MKLAGWAFELDRDRRRLGAAVADVATGKISGPVGTYSQLDPEIEAEVLAGLGLAVDPVSTQVVPRDRHAAFLTAIAVCGARLERLRHRLPHLQRTEVGEVLEPFGAGQKGSSAMPHKRNPILVGADRRPRAAARGQALAALEDLALWHERDISHRRPSGSSFPARPSFSTTCSSG